MTNASMGVPETPNHSQTFFRLQAIRGCVNSSRLLAAESSFRRSLGGKQPTEAELTRYVSSIGEWLNSEFKAATTDIDHGLRRAVCALANARGGEVFLGVRDDRTAVGTDLDELRIAQVLRQERAKPGDWYVVDLGQVVNAITPIQLPARAGKRVWVLEVRPPGVPAFVIEDDGTLSLFVRRGDSSVRANSFSALDWSRSVAREEILRTCYLEVRTLSRTIGGMYIGLATHLGLTVPYLTKRLEDGTLYKYLSEEDLLHLLGRAEGDTRFSGGMYQELFQAKYRIERILNLNKDNYQVDNEVREVLLRAEETLRSRAESFRKYLDQGGIAVE